MISKLNHLLIISHTGHTVGEDGIPRGWPPTVLENRYIAASFNATTILGEHRNDESSSHFIAYKLKNMVFQGYIARGGKRWRDKIKWILSLPRCLWLLHSNIRTQGGKDWIFIRCPCPMGLLALFYLLLNRGKNIWVKYGGNWDSSSQQPLFYRMQRWLLQKNFCRAIVTVNGKWRGQPPHVLTFLNPCFTQDEVLGAREQAENKTLGGPCRILFVGRVEREKGIFFFLKIAKILFRKNHQFRFEVLGSGKDEEEFKARIQSDGLSQNVLLNGTQQRNTLFQFYADAHFILLPSRSEGWPKVLAEAMAFRCLPMASSVGAISQTMDGLEAGICLSSQNPQDWAEEILRHFYSPEQWREKADKCGKTRDMFTYEAHSLQIRKRIFNLPGSVEATKQKPVFSKQN